MPLPRSLPSALLSLLLCGGALSPGLAARAAAPSPTQLQALETALNGEGDAALEALLSAGPGLEPSQLRSRWRQLRSDFPDARWRVQSGPALRDGGTSVTVRVSGTRRQGLTTFRLDAEQQLQLESDGRRFTSQRILREQSVLRSGEKAPAVSVLIPDAVLTGQRYDVDVIFDDPLDGALAAGGIVGLSPQQVAARESPSIELGALAGGGLFKTVRAPLSPGSQTWAVLLVHPQGVVSATKRVRVVGDRRALEL